MRDVEAERPVHQSLRETNSSSAASRPSRARRRGNPARGTPASWRSLSRRPPAARPPTAILPRYGIDADSTRGQAAGPAHAQRHEHAGDQREIEQQLQHRAELDHREMAAGIFQHHRLMHHRQFQMGRRIVDRDAGILRDRHEDEANSARPSDTRRPTRRVHDGGDGRELRRAGDQRQREHDQQHRGLGQRGEHHLATGARSAEARADIHAGQRQEKRRLPSSATMAIRSADQTEHQFGREGRDQRGGNPGGGEHEVGRDAEQPGGVVRDHGFLAQSDRDRGRAATAAARAGAAIGLRPFARDRSAPARAK